MHTTRDAEIAAVAGDRMAPEVPATSTTTRWVRSGAREDLIASTRVARHEPFAAAVQQLFQGASVPYSGIVLSLHDFAATKAGPTGDTVEKSCYQDGGYRFLYRAYAETANPGPGFPTDAVVRLLTDVTTSYLREVVDRPGSAEVEACWAVCQRAGDYATLHNHVTPAQSAEDRYSGMLYLQTPDSINPGTFPNGCIHIVTPNEVVYFPPVPGSILIWPSHLLHAVHPFRGTGDRLGISFNAVAR
jgi:hypothetical protein